MTKLSISKSNWTRENLEKALNTAIAVELFTIPVYLSAASSIRKENRKDTSIPITIKGGTIQTTKNSGIDPLKTLKVKNFSAFDVIMSVAVQEMFHLTLACNLCNALGFEPNITAPDLVNPPSCLKPIVGLPVKGTLSQLINTMVKIEQPDKKYDEPPTDPIAPIGPTNYQDQYDSIGDLYHALAYGVDLLWDDAKVNTENQKKNFEGKYGNLKQVITSKEEAFIAMACITEQGEGIGINKFMAPDYIPTHPAALYHDLDEVDHWDRFLDIQSFLNTPGNSIPQYSTTTVAIVYPTASKDLAQNYSVLIQQLHDSFKSKAPLDLRGMQQTQTYATQIFENGDIPQWNVIADPTPWPKIKNPHSCQGLNECAGQGYNNTGTAAGNGGCATAATHGCQESNNCSNQGGCGYAGKTKGGVKQFAPRENSCINLGGCMSPISPKQFYNTNPDNPHSGKYVWDVARTLFKTKYETAHPGKTLQPSGSVSERRESVTPNSPKAN